MSLGSLNCKRAALHAAAADPVSAMPTMAQMAGTPMRLLAVEAVALTYTSVVSFIPLVVSTPGARAPRLRPRRPLFFPGIPR